MWARCVQGCSGRRRVKCCGGNGYRASNGRGGFRDVVGVMGSRM